MGSKQAISRPVRAWRLKDQGLFTQFLAAGGVVALFMGLSLGIVFFQIRYQAQASRTLSESHRTIGELHRVGRELYRQPSERLAESYLRPLRGILAAEPRQLEALEKLEANIRTGNQEQAHFLIDQMIEEEQRQLQARDQYEKSANSRAFLARALINLALLLVFGFVLYRLYRSIARPIAELSGVIRRYEEGEFGARVQVSSASQIGFLETSFNAMAEKIEAMVADLRKLDELKSDFISTVSHELRTPLTSIGGYVKLIAGGDAGPVNETQKEFLEIIDTNVVRLTHLINDILDVEKMESGKVQLVREPQELSEILNECRATFGLIARQKGLELRFDVPGKLGPVQGDRARLVQIFMNLLSNAIKYTPSGFVEISAEERGYAVIVRVRDSGVGLSGEEQEKLFQKFYRARGGLSSSDGGTGLGLAIVRGLIEAHGGKISVESAPEQGTTFVVSLPIGDEGAEAAAQAGLARQSGEEVRREIWIVDARGEDAASMRGLIQSAAAPFARRVSIVRVFQSIEDVPRVDSLLEAPLMVVLDLGGPAGYGVERISILRKRLQRHIPILVTGESVDTAAAFAYGAGAIVAKPIQEQGFLAAVGALARSKGWRILVADHNTDLRLLIRRGLEQRGYQVDDVERGSQVLGHLEQSSYDLALIDMNFPDVSSFQLLKAIRRSEPLQGLPVFVMLDQDARLPSRDELVSWGADQFVGKYSGIGGIIDAVAEYLEARRALEQRN